MDIHTGGTNAPPDTAIFLAGERCTITLIDVSAEKALIKLHDRSTVWYGMPISLCVGDLPSFPGHIRETSGENISIQFNPALHSTVVDALESVFSEGD